MNDIYQFVLGFVEGDVAPDVFIEKLQSDPCVFDWLQSIVPEGKTCYADREVEGKAYETMLHTLYVFEDADTGDRRIVEQFT